MGDRETGGAEFEAAQLATPAAIETAVNAIRVRDCHAPSGRCGTNRVDLGGARSEPGGYARSASCYPAPDLLAQRNRCGAASAVTVIWRRHPRR